MPVGAESSLKEKDSWNSDEESSSFAFVREFAEACALKCENLYLYTKEFIR